MSHSIRPCPTLNRREFLRLAGIAGSAAVVASCTPGSSATQPPPTGNAEEPQPTDTPSSQAPAAEQITLSWWNQFSTPLCQELFPQIIQEFESQHPNIKVEYELSGGPPGGGEYIEVLLARIAAGNPPDTCTLWTPPSEFGARGALMAIDELMAGAAKAKPDAFYEKPLKSCQWKGKTYGLPASAGAGCIFFNKGLFEEKGISTKREDFPTTWEGLFDLCRKLTTVENGEVTLAGFVPWAQSWLRPVYAQNNGGQIFSADEGVYKINSSNNVEMLEHWLKYLDELYGGDIEAFNLISNWGGDVYPEGAFQLGKAAIDASGSWAPTDAQIPFEWEIAKFPVGPRGEKSHTGFYPNWWAMPKGVKFVNEAFLLTEYFCTDGWVYWYVNGTMDTPAWKNVPPDIFCKAVEKTYGTERAIDFHKFFTEYLNDAAEMWTSPIENFANDTLGQTIDEVLHKAKTPEEALANAQELCQTKLQETLESL